MTQLAEWLLEGSPWVQYRTRVDLLDEPEADRQVRAAREAMIAHPWVRGLLSHLYCRPAPAKRNHRVAGHPLHKLAFLVDLGLRSDDPEMAHIIDRIMASQTDQGPFQILLNINPAYGGTGEDQLAWMLCDAPLVVYALAKCGLADSIQVQAAMRHLVALARDNGWPCAVAPDLGSFRGPGRKSDPCPYANLLMLKALAHMPQGFADRVARTGTETLLSLWGRRRERRPYLFAMGTNFAKLKAPLVWYDILHLTEVLTQFAWTKDDARLREMTQIVRSKSDEQGRFAAESVWTDWKEWDFGQKRTPSRWVTLLGQRILKRLSI